MSCCGQASQRSLEEGRRTTAVGGRPLPDGAHPAACPDRGAPEPVDWNLFVTVTDGVWPLWSGVEIPVLDPPLFYDVRLQSLPRIGKIGFLTTFVTAGEGIVCSDFEIIDSGTP